MSADILALAARGMLAASAAILLVLALRAPARRWFGARAAYWLWLLVPAATFAAYLPARLVVAAAPDAAMASPRLSSVASFAAQSGHAASANSFTPADAAPYVLLIWIAGAAFSTLVLFLQQRHTVRRLQLKRDGALYRAGDAEAAPAVIGVVAPRIVVPADFERRYDTLEQTLVLAHERAHIRAGDALVNAGAALAQCLNWFNPLFYAARTALRVDQELACDERVMRSHAGARRAYAEAMLKTQLTARAIPLGCHWPPMGARSLKQRISMLKRPQPTPSARMAGAAACGAVVLAGSIAVWAAQPPRIAYAAEQPERASSAPRASGVVAAALGSQLVTALQENDSGQARDLIEAGADVNHFTPGDGTPLVIASRNGDRELVALLLEAGADANRAAPGDGSPLIVAAAAGQMEILSMLMAAGADVNGYVRGDETPLINASRENRLAAAAYLIDRGADVNLAVDAPTIRGLERRSPMSVARQRGHEEMMRLLRRNGASN